MSEDTAHGQHFEPGPINGEEGQLGPSPAQDPLQSQVERVAQLGVRVLTLLDTARDTFEEFIIASSILLQAAALAETKETNVNRPTNSTTAQTS